MSECYGGNEDAPQTKLYLFRQQIHLAEFLHTLSLLEKAQGPHPYASPNVTIVQSLISPSIAVCCTDRPSLPHTPVMVCDQHPALLTAAGYSTKHHAPASPTPVGNLKWQHRTPVTSVPAGTRFLGIIQPNICSNQKSGC